MIRDDSKRDRWNDGHRVDRGRLYRIFRLKPYGGDGMTRLNRKPYRPKWFGFVMENKEPKDWVHGPIIPVDDTLLYERRSLMMEPDQRVVGFWYDPEDQTIYVVLSDVKE